MLDFQLDESNFKVRCFTSVEWISEKFKHRQLKFVDRYEDSDICIVDSNFEFKENSGCSIKISIDELSNSVNAFISPGYIVSYLDLIEKYESGNYSVGMADFNDIKTVTNGSLIEYIKIKLNNDDETEVIEEFKKNLKPTEFNGGIILFLSVKNLKRLSNFAYILEDIYPNMDKVIMTPTKRVSNADNYVEIFIFKKV